MLKEIGRIEPESRKISDAEIITTCVVSALYFSGNQEMGICFVRNTKLVHQFVNTARYFKPFILSTALRFLTVALAMLCKSCLV